MNNLTYKAVLCDIGGVLHVGGTPIEGAVEAIAYLKQRCPVRLLTNSTQKTAAQILQHLQNMGFCIEPHELITALDMAKLFLSRHHSSATYILTDDAKAFFDDLSALPKRYVLVGDAQANYNYENLNNAFRALISGCKLIATSKNRYYKTGGDQLTMDAGGFVQALEYASGKTAHILGKPSSEFFHMACKSMGISPEEVIMIGDDIEGDILGAQNAGLKAVLVKTGKFMPEDLKHGITPDYTIDSIARIIQRKESRYCILQ
jgi:HAD superfamily hydrolase (TIGR01458 family)